MWILKELTSKRTAPNHMFVSEEGSESEIVSSSRRSVRWAEVLPVKELISSACGHQQ